MGRNKSQLIKIYDDDSAATNIVGTSSDNFISQNVEEFLPIETTNTDLPVEDPNSFFIDEEVNVLPPFEENNLDFLTAIQEESKDDVTDEYISYEIQLEMN